MYRLYNEDEGLWNVHDWGRSLRMYIFDDPESELYNRLVPECAGVPFPIGLLPDLGHGGQCFSIDQEVNKTGWFQLLGYQHTWSMKYENLISAFRIPANQKSEITFCKNWNNEIYSTCFSFQISASRDLVLALSYRSLPSAMDVAS